jgi:hypothetical protein
MSLSITSTYAGEFAGKYISAALLSGNTISNGLIEVKPNVKFKEVLKRVSLTGAIANASCDFTDAGAVVLTERIIEPKELQINLELCKTPFQSDWDAIEMGFSAHDNMPKTFSDYFIGLMAAEISAQTETDIWSGTAGAGTFDGFATLLTAATLPAGQDITGVAITPANVVAELGKVVDALPTALYGNEDLYIYVASNVLRAYKRAIAAAGGSVQGNNQDLNVEFFDGIKVVSANGLASDTMVSTLKSNLYFGTGLLNDQNEIKVLDMSDLDGSKNVRFIARYTAAVQIAILEDVVFYS